MALVLLLLFQAVAGWRYNATGIDEAEPASHAAASDLPAASPPPASPLTFFEVSRPIPVPSAPCAHIQLLKHSFGNTIKSPPVVVSYNPPDRRKCHPSEWEKVVFRWRATSQGRQFDRISAVWLNGVEIFRTCTAEPVKQGILWEVEKDVTKFSSILRKPSRDLAVSLGNVIDSTYTGFFNVTLSLDFYTSSSSKNKAHHNSPPADRILPVALPTSTNGGYWFKVQNDADIQVVKLAKLPRNIYRAELEVCLSFHGDDEFWYTNPTDDYLRANNMTAPGNGAFREVVAYLDDHLVAEICPLPVIFTGGINPLMWRPAAAIGAFNLPTYTVDLTPFVGRITDGGQHEVRLGVTNALAFWLLNANLHLWLDRSAAQTSGQLTGYSAPPADIRSESEYKGPDGTISISASRSLSYSGLVVSPAYGNSTTSVWQWYGFTNRLEFSAGGNVSVVTQRIRSRSRLVVNGGDGFRARHAERSYPLDVYSSEESGENKTVINVVSVSHGFVEELYDSDNRQLNRVENTQQSGGKIWVANGNTVVKGDGDLRQHYSFRGNGVGCYNRDIRARNTSLLSDHVNTSCDR